MSIISTRPQVRSVVNARVLTNVCSTVEVLRAVTQQSAGIMTQLNQVSPVTSVHALPQLGESVRQLQQRQFRELRSQRKLSQIDALRISTLSALSQHALVLENPQAVNASLHMMRTASTITEAKQAQQQLMREILTQHNQVLTNTLKGACVNALRRIGFSSIQTRQGMDEKVRIAASNGRGKTLVTEIETDPRREPSISTEIVSGCDSETPAILDAFDKALEEEGVRSSAPIREETGGICRLETAKDFVGSRVRPAATSEAPCTTASDEGARRSQRLNSRNRNRQRGR